VDEYRHDLFGREVDGAYWGDLEADFERDACIFRACGDELAAAIADRLAETADDVPAQLISEFQDCWDGMDQYPENQSPAERTMSAMMTSLAAGYSPATATAFVVEFIRRVTGMRPS
jgi:hypothetical protein